jgi:hypothetical protein
MSDPAITAIWSQLVAVEMTVIALINTHPDPKALLLELQDLIADMQIGAAQAGAPTTPEPVRLFLDRMLDQIQSRVP